MIIENKKTISHLNNKAWYRLLKVIFGLIFLIVLGVCNYNIYYDGIKRLDLDKTIVNCNVYDLLDNDVPSHQITLKQVDSYFNNNEFNNFNYTDYIKNYNYNALAIANKCQENSKYHFRIVKFGTSTTPIFIINPTYSYIEFFRLFIIYNFIILFIFEAVRRTFYYIVLGSIKPEK